ncbi:AGAP005819-PA-like protein [Anopheles sinensis]|uniref:AGAP005819-PA-like protein n=1 Tax=Anopheles sinensis TaxID=74873 RepID=A0A084WDE0_ANOSI|nr:AGAP005819-PA-like protein [Anopheles sinensis]
MEVLCLPTKEAVKQGHLVLDSACDYFVHRNIVNKLAVHQLEGVRFLYNQLREYTGIFLNDESGLGKCYQIVALLSGTAVVSERPSIILCPNVERTHHWMYHLDVLSPSLRARVHPKSQLEVANELTVLKGTEWQYAIVDETRGFMTSPELERLRVLAVQKIIFLSSRDLLDELMVLSSRLQFSCGSETEALQSMINEERKRKTKRNSFRLYLCTRRFILRRRVRHYRQHLPLVKKAAYLECFNAWKVANNIEVSDTSVATDAALSLEYSIPTVRSQESAFLAIRSIAMPPEVVESTHRKSNILKNSTMLSSEDSDRTSPIDLDKPTPIHFAGSEPLFDFNETNTEQMPPLRVESDTSPENETAPGEGEINIPETATSSGGAIDIPETVTDSEGYFQFGQQISGGSTSTQPVLADDRYRFPVEKLHQQPGTVKAASGSSLSGESLPNAQPPVVTISSSDSPPKSPPLFEDTDNDTLSMNSSDEDISILKKLDKSASKSTPTSRAVPRKTELVRRQPSVSTPIAKLMYGSLANVTPQREVNVSSADIFGLSPIAPVPPALDNVFEITKNSAFANRIVVREDDEAGVRTMQLADDSSDDDEVQFVDETVRVINVDDLSGTPKSDQRTSPGAAQRTPPSGGSNLGLSPGRGWLGKSLRTSSVSPRSSNVTPTTRTRNSPGSGGNGSTFTRGGVPIIRDANRRRKLEELFKDVEGYCSDHAKRTRHSKSGSKTHKR